jgi:hypothetical protein
MSNNFTEINNPSLIRNDTKLLLSDEHRQIISILTYIFLVFGFLYILYYFKDDLTKQLTYGFMYLFIFFGLSYFLYFLNHLVNSKPGELAIFKVLTTFFFICTIAFVFFIAPESFDLYEIFGNYKLTDISILIFSLFTSVLLINSSIGFISINKNSSEFYTYFFSAFAGVLLIYKLFFSNGDIKGGSNGTTPNLTNLKDSYGFKYGFPSILLLIISWIVNSETQIFSKNTLGFNSSAGILMALVLIFIFINYLLEANGQSSNIINNSNSFFYTIAILLIPTLNYMFNLTEYSDRSMYIIFGIISILFFMVSFGNIFNFEDLPPQFEIFNQFRKDSQFSQGIIMRLILGLIVIFSGWRYLYVINEDIGAYEEMEEAKKAIIFLFPILLIMAFATNIFNAGSSLMSIFYLASTFALYFGWSYFSSSLDDSQKEFVNYIINILFVISIILALAIVVSLTGNYFTSKPGMMGLLSNLLFYIPCLVVDLIEWIKNEFNNTTPTTLVILLLEIFVIFAYFYLPSMLDNKIFSRPAIEIINEPITLKEEIELLGGEKFKMENDKMIGKQNNIPRHNYSISMWVNINTNSHNLNAMDNELNIFSYNFKPSVEFRINTDNPNGENTHFVFKLSNNLDKKEKYIEKTISLPLQKWHNFVFTYDNNTVDIFVNAELYHSYTFKVGEHPTYNVNNDNIFIGDNQQLSGVICNARYFTNPLTDKEIITTYNLLNNLNPPINNL